MKFRILILKDPDAKKRGFSLQGIKVPLTTWCPVKRTPDLLQFGGKDVVAPRYEEYWHIPVEALIDARPSIRQFFKKGVDTLAVPTDWCDVAPIDSMDDLKSWEKK